MLNSIAGPFLVVMAAGAARRFGGLKQLAPVGPNGESMMEFSIHDAFKAGFSKVVLVIRRESEAAFRNQFVDRASAFGTIEFAYQDADSCVPDRWQSCRRKRPWGTAHAVLCAAAKVDRPFAVMNADDHYGFDAMTQISAALGNGLPHRQDKCLAAAMVGYQLRNTLSDNGEVSRGICEVDGEKCLKRIVERHAISRIGGGGNYRDANGIVNYLPGDATTSMNLWGLPVEIFEHLQHSFSRFLDGPRADSLEFELPASIQSLIEQGVLRVRVLTTEDRWCGITYADDLPIVQRRMTALVSDGFYPRRLWKM